MQFKVLNHSQCHDCHRRVPSVDCSVLCISHTAKQTWDQVLFSFLFGFRQTSFFLWFPEQGQFIGKQSWQAENWQFLLNNCIFVN